MERGTIRNIIFDLGGVIMDIDPSRTYHEFSTLCNKTVEEITGIYHNTLFFRQYEAGNMSDEVFRDKVRKSLNCNNSDEEIDHAWNALLIGVAEDKIRMLEDAHKKYTTYLLSNTNNIHRLRFEKFFADDRNRNGIYSYFSRLYYSYDLKLRKPDPEIYKYVLSDNDLDPSETLMIDDNRDNIESARLLGMQVMQVIMNQPSIEIPG